MDAHGCCVDPVHAQVLLDDRLLDAHRVVRPQLPAQVRLYLRPHLLQHRCVLRVLRPDAVNVRLPLLVAVERRVYEPAPALGYLQVPHYCQSYLADVLLVVGILHVDGRE